MKEVLEQGLALMATGMGVVFLFLTVMVGVMMVTAKFFERFGHRFAEEPAPESHLKRLAMDDSVEIAVAIAAIKNYNQN